MTVTAPEGRGLLRSTVLRFTVAYLLLFALSAALLLAWLYWSVTAYLEQQSEDVIAAEVQGLAEQYRARGLAGLVGVLALGRTVLPSWDDDHDPQPIVAQPAPSSTTAGGPEFAAGAPA